MAQNRRAAAAAAAAAVEEEASAGVLALGVTESLLNIAHSNFEDLHKLQVTVAVVEQMREEGKQTLLSKG